MSQSQSKQSLQKIGQKQNTQILYNWQALKLYLPYLKLSDLLSSATISKQWQYHLKQYIKQFILPQNTIQTLNINNLSNTDIFQIVKTVFHRKLVLYDNTHKNTKQIQFPYICSSIQIANYVTKLQTLDGNTYIIKNDKLTTITKKDWNNCDQINIYKVGKNYNKCKVIGNYIYLLSDSRFIRYTTTHQNILNDQFIYEFQGSIIHFISSISAVLLVVQVTSKQQQYIFFTHKEPKPKKIQIKIQIDNPITDIILDYGEHGFIISSQGTTYQAHFEQADVKLQELKILKGKLITKIKCGAKHYFAFQRKKKLIKKWTNNQVLKWAEQQGFQQYMKIFKAQKITGQKLLEINKTYMQDVLGMTSTLTQQKINLLVHQSNKNTDNFDDYIVYCWGRNEKGQLCINPSANINNPVKLKLPENTQIYACYGDQTLLKNTKTQQVTINILDQQGKLKWEHLTYNRLWACAGYKNLLIYCESMGKKKIPQAMSQEPIHMKKEKLRTAKNIMDQIQWDTNLKQQQFTVGYLARFQGTLECSFEEFLKSDVKQNNVLYFKQNGKLVWDKKSRLDTL